MSSSRRSTPSTARRLFPTCFRCAWVGVGVRGGEGGCSCSNNESTCVHQRTSKGTGLLTDQIGRSSACIEQDMVVKPLRGRVHVRCLQSEWQLLWRRQGTNQDSNGANGGARCFVMNRGQNADLSRVELELVAPIEIYSRNRFSRFPTCSPSGLGIALKLNGALGLCVRWEG
jgi:hypothetical protein